MLRLIPVVESSSPDQQFDWVPSDTSPAWIELDAHSTDAEVARVVATLAISNRIAMSGSIETVAQALENGKILILPGGLLIRAGDLDILPGCCCGLESWREWFGVASGGRSPWLGHDPSPLVECKDDRAIILADSDLGDQSPRVSVSYPELDDARQSAQAALQAFTARLSDWLSGNAPNSIALSQRFAEAFSVNPTSA